jgi:dihydrofolate synthase/folylpolyglutamate synthase
MAPRERLFALEQFGIKLGLDNIAHLLDGLNHPERAWPAVHVAGTNGKGSVTAMVERALRAAGHRTGRYTSPHLSRIEERIAIDGVAVASETFDAVAEHVLGVVDQLRARRILATEPTFFEVTTAMAFEIFRRAAVSVGVIEVGLGGRFDSTNVITPAVTVITTIALDHERHLGTTVPEIAREKAGIIKYGRPVVVGDLEPSAMAVVTETAASLEAPLVVASADCATDVRLIRGRATMNIRTPEAAYGPLRLGLAGAHQVGNAIVAVRTLERCHTVGIRMSRADIVAGLTTVEWPARLEWVRLPNGNAVLLDAAHNPAGALALADYLRESGLAPLPLVIAVMRDKDVEGMIAAFAAVASVIVTTQTGSARSLSATELAEFIRRRHPTIAVDASENRASAIDRALQHGRRVAVAGSIFLVGPMRQDLVAQGGRPEPDDGL